MSFVKRAALSLLARAGRTLIMFGLLAVICTLVLGGFLVQRAAGAAANRAKQQVGTEATLQWDMEKALAKGGFGGTLPENARLNSLVAEKLGRSDLVSGYNYTLEGGTVPQDATPVSAAPPPAGLPAEMRDNRMIPLLGTLASEQLRDFRDGHFMLLRGRGIGVKDRDRDVVVIEERFATTNHLDVGGRVTLTNPEGGNPRPFEIVGVFRDPTQSPTSWVSPQMEPGNKLLVPLDTIGRLDPSERLGGGMRINEAVYRLKDPNTLNALRKQAIAAGIDMKVFKIAVNDKQYQQLVGPIQNVASFATVTVWLVGLAGAAVPSAPPRLPGRTGPADAPPVAPIDRLNVRLRSGDLLKIGLVGLAIAMAAVAVPTSRIVRLQPREILTKGE